MYPLFVGNEMSDGTGIVPVTDEQAKTIRAAIEALSGLGRFLEVTFGTLPQDVVGLLGGDWLRIRRAENAANILKRAQERLEARG
jgi:hypothetical protein